MPNSQNTPNSSNPESSTQNKPGASAAPVNASAHGAQGNRPDGDRAAAGSSSDKAQQFGGVRREQSQGSDASGRGGSQEITRFLDAIQENCSKLRAALGSKGSDSKGASDSRQARDSSSSSDVTDESSTQSGRSPANAR